MENESQRNSSHEMNLTKCLVSYIVKSPSQSYINNVIAACLINGIFLIVGCFLNMMVVVVFCKSKQLRSKMTLFPLLVLCSVDLATVLVVHPLFLVETITEVKKTPKCLYKVIYFSALYIFPATSISTLCLMNIERYIAIVKPFWYLQVSKKKQKFFFACIICWLLMAGNLSCRLIKPPYSKAFTMVVICIACLISLFTYGSIFYVARNRRRFPVSEDTSSESSEDDIRRRKANFLNDLKVAKTYFIAISISFICYLPIGIVVFATNYPWQKNETRKALLVEVYIWADTLLTLSSTFNCLVFFWANTGLRKQAWRLWSLGLTSNESSSNDDKIRARRIKNYNKLS